MKTKRRFFALQTTVIVAFTVLNMLLFYLIHCSGEYIQSRDVWGKTQTIRRTDLASRQKLLNTLPREETQAVAELDRILGQIEAWEKQDTTPEDGTAFGQDMEVMRPYVDNKDNYLAVRELYINALSYQEDMKEIASNAKSMSQTALYKEGWFLNNIVKTERDFYGLDYIKVAPLQDYAWNAVFNFRISDVLALGMAILEGLLLFYFWRGQTDKMLPGVPGLLVKSSLMALAGFCVVYLGNFFVKELFFERSNFSVSLQSLEAFRSCPYNLSIGSFCLIYMLFKLSAFALIFVWVLCLLSCSSNRRKIYIGVAVGLSCVEFLLAMYKGSGATGVFFREINVFSAVSPERFFNRYLNLNIAGGAYSRLLVFVLWWSALLIVGLYLGVRFLGRHHRQTEQMAQNNYNEEINRQYTEIRHLWHDFQNHLLTIQALNESGDREGADAYVKELNESISQNQLVNKTGCTPVDLLLYKKQQLSREQGTELKMNIQCRLDSVKIAAYDLCSMLGNMLDNALEAVEKLPYEKRRIELDIKRKQQMLFFSCKNPFGGQCDVENGKFLTTKQDKEAHGLGLASLKQVCKKYQGSMEISTDNDEFLVYVIVMEKE